MKFSIIHPSRGRPELALATAIKWIKEIGSEHKFEYILSIDTDDPMKKRYYELLGGAPMKAQQGELNPAASKDRVILQTILENNNRNVVDAMNVGAAAAKFGDVLVCISDDMEPMLMWGSAIAHNIDIDLPEALQVNHLNPDIKEDNDILCLPIMTRKLYDKLGYVYFPKYTGIYADDDLARLCRSQGWLRKNFKLIFPHIHWSIDKNVKRDATHLRHDNPQGWKLGARILEERKNRNFDLPEPEKILSILIPTVDGRESDVRRLMTALVDQLKKDGYMDIVELLYDQDNKEKPIGRKRQDLYETASGKYSWQIDDDDWFNPEVFRKVIPSLLKQPDIDCVGFLEECSFDGRNKKIACHSNRFQEWGTRVEGFEYVRTIFYKDIVRTAIAKEIGVNPELRYGEDHDFAQRLKASGLLKKELFLKEIMYYYHCNTRIPHNTKYGIK